MKVIRRRWADAIRRRAVWKSPFVRKAWDSAELRFVERKLRAVWGATEVK